MSNPTEQLILSPLDAAHRSLGAKMVPFAGWSMPVTYDGLGVMAEHEAVRNRAGLFDVSHMGEFLVEGPKAKEMLQYLIPNDLERLKPGGALYSPICNEKGGIVDDCLVYWLEDDQYMVVVNAANTQKDFDWFESHWSKGATLRDISRETALLALQGPKAIEIIKRVAPALDLENFSSFTSQKINIDGADCRISRTGYTGEDGVEIYLPWNAGEMVFQKILKEGKEDGIVPAGLAARDTTRLEARLPLYGNDIDDGTSPLEAGLAWTVKFAKGDFIGKSVLEAQKAEGVPRKLVGFILRDKGIARGGYPVTLEKDGPAFSQVTSGTRSPTLGESIGLCYVPRDKAKIGNTLWVEIRNKRLRAEVVPTPFYKRQQSR